MPTFWIGDRVAVVGGTYKGRYGTYRGDYGRVMCQVEIDGDDRATRNIWKSSIRKMVKEEDEGDHQQQQQQNITLTAAQHTELLNQIRNLADMVEALKIKVENL